MNKKTYCGFITILGATNSGKSTLINQIIGQKISITSHKVQTTRSSFNAVKMIENKQLIFTDTPGIFNPKRRLDKAMISNALSNMNEADLILLLIDAKKGITETIRNLSLKLKDNNNIFIALNKCDITPKNNLLVLADELTKLFKFQEVFMISALKNDGISSMLKKLSENIPERDYIAEPKDGALDTSDNLYLSEITREKIYKYLHQELPYFITVITEKIEQEKDGLLSIHQKILVQNDNHKKILLGKNGSKIKQIGTSARLDIQKEWNIKVRLYLFIKVEKNWEDKEEIYIEQGLKFKK